MPHVAASNDEEEALAIAGEQVHQIIEDADSAIEAEQFVETSKRPFHRRPRRGLAILT